MQQPILNTFNDGGRIDPRREKAKDLLDTHPSGVVKVYKTTRAGATTSIIMEAQKRGEKCVIIEPTHHILDKTIKQCVGAERFRKVVSNKECLRNLELCKEYPDLMYLESVPLPGDCGKDCEHYAECDVVAPIRNGWDVLGITYTKLCTLVASQYGKKDIAFDDEPSTPSLLLDELSLADNYILDECHCLAGGKRKTQRVAVIGKGDDPGKLITSQTQKEANGIYDRFVSLQDAFPGLHQIAVQFGSLIEDEDIRAHMATVAERALGKVKNERWSIKTKTGRQLGSGRDDIAMRLRELVRLMKTREEYGLSVRDVVFLQEAHWIMISQWVSIAAKWENGHIVVKIHALDNVIQTFLPPFLNKVSYEAHERSRKCRIVMTTATFVDHDFKQYVWKGSEIAEYWWDDPRNNNRRHLVLCDSSRYQAWGERARSIQEYVNFIQKVASAYGNENVMVVAISKRLVQELREYLSDDIVVEHYRSSWSQGTGTERRILVAVGAGYTPSNTYDPIAENLEDSKRMRLESMRAATANAWGRGKDSEGMEASIVFTLGVTEAECREIFTWGTGRKLEGVKWAPRVARELAKPSIKKCETWAVMLERAKHHLGPNYEERLGDIREERRRLIAEYFKQCQRSLLLQENEKYSDLATSLEENLECKGKKELMLCNTRISGKSAPLCADFYMCVDAIGNFHKICNSPELAPFNTKYTFDSMTANSEHFSSNMKSVFVSDTTYFKNIYSLLKERFISRWDGKTIMHRDGEGGVGIRAVYTPDEGKAKRNIKARLCAHIHLSQCIIIPALDRFGCGIWGCYDIDAHVKVGERPTDPDAYNAKVAKLGAKAPKLMDGTIDIIKKRYIAEEKCERLCDTLDKFSMPYLLERSGSPSSFHIWLFFERTGAKLLRAFMESIAREAEVEGIEINPKQVHHSANSKCFGNGVRIPFSIHPGHKGVSKVLVNGKWIGTEAFNVSYSVPTSDTGEWLGSDDFEGIPIGRINISQFDPELPVLEIIGRTKRVASDAVARSPDADYVMEFDGVEWVNGASTDEYSGDFPDIRPIFSWALNQDLSGMEGHNMRFLIVRTFHNAGYSPEDIAKLFAGQADYDFDISLKYVEGQIRVECGHIRNATIWQLCPMLAARFEAETGKELRIR